jgi:exodeoxyribonuclease-5
MHDVLNTTALSLILSQEQKAALDAIEEWYHNGDDQVFLLEGPAGCGKTTIARHIGELLKINVAYASFTGKAASVLRAKGCKDATTIHALIYSPQITYVCKNDPVCKIVPCRDRCPHVREQAGDWELNPRALNGVDLVLIDEVSMVGSDLGRDLCSFDTKILVVGDRAQLPPIEGGGYFTNRKPDFHLTQIHRQEAGSPVIELATRVRLGGVLRPGDYGASTVMSQSLALADRMLGYDQIICGTHRMRNGINREMRRLLGLDGDVPAAGEKIVCLRNSKPQGLYNGVTYEVIAAEPDGSGFCDMTVKGDDGRLIGVVAPIAAFGLPDNSGRDYPKNPFDFGYAITCHKAQGSQWKGVFVIDQSYYWRRDGQQSQWLYTAITRAADRVFVGI